MKKPGTKATNELAGRNAPGMRLKDREPRKGYIRLNKCHTFEWSRSLWADAVKQTGRIATVLVVVYLLMGYYLLAYNSGLRGVDCWYFLAATLTTVGFGDYYPETETTRGLAIVLLPFGLVVISFGISIAVAQANATKLLLPSDKRVAEAKEAAAAKAQEEASAALLEEQQLADKSWDVRFPEERNKLLTESPRKQGASSRRSMVSAQQSVDLDRNRSGSSFAEQPSSKDEGGWEAFKKTKVYDVCKLLAKYCGTVLLGAIVLMSNTDERNLQAKLTSDGELTFIDALYLSTVTACTIGYGHIITPLSGPIKGFFIVYMFVSTYVVGQIIGELSGLHISIKEDAITAILIDSTTWVHKADIDGDGKITEADYVLFKLQQMQKVDLDMLDRLLNRFRELDVEGEGALDIGIDVPSASQVAEMQRVVKATGQTLPKLWLEIQSEIVKQAKAIEELEKGSAPKPSEVNEMGGVQISSGENEECGKQKPINYVKLNECHDFKWSRKLWAQAAKETGRLAGVLVVGYLIFIYVCMASLDGLTGLDCWYYIVATVTTVGFGDFAPTSQSARAASLIFMPAGLVIIGFGISFATASNRARPNLIAQSNGGMNSMGGIGGADRNHTRSMFNALSPLRMALASQFERNNADFAGGRVNSSSSNASQAATALAAQHLETIDEDKKESPVDTEPTMMDLLMKRAKEFKSSVVGKAAWLLFKLTAVVLVGACFFKFYKPEDDALELTWVDACYFAMVCATSIGYGDITAQTDGGKVFMLFYMLVSTVLVAGILGEFIDLYVCDMVGEGIIEQIIDSTIWVHRADLDGDGRVTEADYVLFKLQQMQKVDLQTLDMLIDRYEELDIHHDGALDIGVDVPSATQVVEMQAELIAKGDTRTIVELWQEKKFLVQQANEEDVSPTMESPLALEEQCGLAAKAPAGGKSAIYEDTATGFKGTYAEVVNYLEARQKAEVGEGDHVPPLKGAKSEQSVLAQKWQELRGRASSVSTGVKLFRGGTGGGGGGGSDAKDGARPGKKRSQTVSDVEMTPNPMGQKAEKPVSV